MLIKDLPVKVILCAKLSLVNSNEKISKKYQKGILESSEKPCIGLPALTNKALNNYKFNNL